MWIDIDNNYAVSENGEVLSKRYDRLLKPFFQGKYHAVWLGKGKKAYIHHLVAKAFLPVINELNLEIDHINRDRFDNRACNLRYCSHSINMKNRNSEYKPRSTNQTGEFGISKVKNRSDLYIVSLRNQRHCIKSLEEAIKKRDEIVNALSPDSSP